MNERTDHDDEFEVSDLPAAPSADGAQRPSDAFAARASILARRITPRRRRLAGVTLAIIGVALVLGLALREYSAATQGATTGATADPRVAAASVVYFKDSAAWGVLRVNGQVANMTQLLGKQLPLNLPLGVTRIDYSAPPYPALHCVITDPPARSDTCPLVKQYAPQDPVQEPGEGRLIDLRANLTRLPAAQFSALEQATEAALATAATSDAATFAPSITLAPGDHYLNAQGQVSVATQPLRATLRLAFDRSALVNADWTNGPPCRVFCVYSADGALQAPITPTWVYTTVDTGARITTSPYLRADIPNIPSNGDGSLQIDVQWNGGWQVAVEPYYLLAMGQSWCNDGALALQSLTSDQNLGDIQGQGVGDAQGCSYIYQPPGVTTPQNPGALFLFRCGVVLAANVAAQQFLPKLPMASPAEAQVAASLAGERYAAP